jgi:hypothetical protein
MGESTAESPNSSRTIRIFHAYSPPATRLQLVAVRVVAPHSVDVDAAIQSATLSAIAYCIDSIETYVSLLLSSGYMLGFLRLVS